MRSNRGFTMVEMLVVVCALSLLLAAIWVARPCPRYRGRSPCGNNVGNLIKCCHLYSDAFTNAGNFPLCDERHNSKGHEALAKLYGAYVKDHRVYSCPSKPTNTAGLTRYVAPDESTLFSGYTNYGYDPGHTPVHATAGVIGDRGNLHATNHWNSTNHGNDGPGQNVAIGAGSVEWWDAADQRATRTVDGRATTDDIYADDLDPTNFPEELETNIIR